MSRFVSPGAGINYMQFMFPGILGMTILFSSIFSSISIIWDKEFGLMKEILVAPVSRFSIVIGKALSGTLISVIQVAIILMLFPFLGIKLSFPAILNTIAVAVLLAFCISSLGIVIASFYESFESFSVIMNFIVMPMFFLSGKLNPLTYGVDALKHAIFGSGELVDFSIFTDLGVLVVTSLVFVTAAGFLFERKK
jgi:ABC-2 type transport system permease protein